MDKREWSQVYKASKMQARNRFVDIDISRIELHFDSLHYKTLPAEKHS